MAQKREVAFDSIYGGNDQVDKDEMLDGNKDLPTKNTDDNEEVKLKKENELRSEANLEINGKAYHITF